MNKSKRQRVEIRSELVPDAQELQQVCGLESWGAAINMVFALYRRQLLQKLKEDVDNTADIQTIAKKVADDPELRTHSSRPTPSTNQEIRTSTSGGSLRDFLRAKVREGY